MRRNKGQSSPLDSPAFRRWFGDSVAVSDRDGEPLVVYHGGFDVIGSQAGSFRTSRTGRWGAGIYFTPFRFKAEHYAEDWAMDEGRPGTVGAYYLRIERPFVVGQGDAYRDGMAELLQAVRESGEHDGIVVLDTTGPSGRTMRMGRNVEEIVVFSPKQVKAAFDNDGAFDRDSSDVRKNPVADLLVSQLAPQDVKRLNAMEAEWSRYVELADLAYEAGLTDEGDELSEAADAAADRLEDVISAIEESEASDHAEHELEGALFDAYEDFRRGGPAMGLSSEDELAKHARWHFSEHGVIVDAVSDRDIVDAVYDVWLWRKKLLNMRKNPGHSQEDIDEALERLDEMIGQLDFSLVQEGEDLSFRKRRAMGYHYTSERNLQAIAREGLGGKVAFEPHEFAFWLAMPYVAPDDAASVLLDAEKDQRRAYSRGEPSQKTLDKLQALLDEVSDLHVVWFYREPGMAGVTAGRRERCVKFNLHDVGEWLSQNADSVNQFTDYADGYAVAWIGQKIPPEFLEDCGEEF